MSGEHEALSSNRSFFLTQSSNKSCSSSVGQQDGSEDHANADLAAMAELSKTIVDEISSNQLGESSHRAPIIFRVPKVLRAAGEGAYTPTFVSIGPYHHGDAAATEEMRRNEKVKLAILGRVIKEGGPPVVLEYLKGIAAMEAETRRCYEGDISMGRDAFRKMILLDGMYLICLMLELLGLGREQENVEGGSEGRSEDGTVSGEDKIHKLIMILHDLMMLENQIPFSVVEKIYELRYGQGRQPAVIELAWRTMTGIMDGAPTAASLPVKECRHLIDLCLVYLKPTSVLLQHRMPAAGTYGGRFRRATEYYEAGVKFRPWSADSTGSQRPPLDVEFSDGVLRMALQKVDEKADHILRNVLAYEQRYAAAAGVGYVTAYVMFMSQLLAEPEDVALLARRGIMGHLLGSDAEVCALFRGLATGFTFDPDGSHYLNTVGVALWSHCRQRRHQWHAWGRRHHFGNPWLVAAWVFGATTVLCAILLTVFAVLSYVNGVHDHN